METPEAEAMGPLPWVLAAVEVDDRDQAGMVGLGFRRVAAPPAPTPCPLTSPRRPWAWRRAARSRTAGPPRRPRC